MAQVSKLLVVDDNENNRDLLSRRLRRKGFAVDSAVDGFRALEALDREAYDLVLLDLEMPGMSGLQVLDTLRKTTSQLALPVIIVTAIGDNATVVEALGRGANDYVTKPIEFSVVLARIHAQLNLKRAHDSQLRSAQETAKLQELSDFEQRYEILELLGEGGYAVVYKARQLATGQLVAIKLLRTHRLNAAHVDVETARFEREMQVIGSIRHPNIVRLIDAGHVLLTEEPLLGHRHAYDASPDLSNAPTREVSETQVTRALGPGSTEPAIPHGLSVEPRRVPYLVMEYLEGETLHEHLRSKGTLSLSETVQILVPVLGAVHTAHQRGVLHRDLKPANIFLARMDNGSVFPQVLDFGVAKLMGDENVKLTMTSSVLGTPAFMSPEQALDDPLTPASDQFALGVILYCCLTGRIPYTARAVVPLLQQVANGELTPPTEHRPDLPEAMEAVVLRALSTLPTERYLSLEDFTHALITAA